MLKVLDEMCKPTKGSKHSAFIDLYSCANVTIDKGSTAIVPLGVAIDFEYLSEYFAFFASKYDITDDEYDIFFIDTHYFELQPRSSLRAKGVMSGTGIIDMDYKDEIKIILHNLNDSSFHISKGERIAQIALKTHESYKIGIHTDEERNGGFGSTGGYNE